MLFNENAIKTPHQVFDLRQQYHRNGFPPVAICNGEKFPQQKRWPELARLPTPDACQWTPDRHQLSTGILADGLRPIDVDIDDPIKAQAVLDYIINNFGYAPMRYRSNSPRILALFAAAEGHPSKTSVTTGCRCNRKPCHCKQAVEILGKGNQFVADGVHQTGVPILWRGGSPETVQRSELIALTDTQVQALLAFCASVLGVAAPIPRAARSPSAIPCGGPHKGWHIGDVRAALAEISHRNSSREDWFRIGCAVWDATNGSTEGYEAWRDWSQSCPSYTDAAATTLWNSLHPNHPNRITAGTLRRAVTDLNPTWVEPSKTTFTKLRIFNHQ